MIFFPQWSKTSCNDLRNNFSILPQQNRSRGFPMKILHSNWLSEKMLFVVWPFDVSEGPCAIQLQALSQSLSPRITQGHLGQSQTSCPPAVRNVIAFFKHKGSNLSKHSADLNALPGKDKVICTGIPSWREKPMAYGVICPLCHITLSVPPC